MSTPPSARAVVDPYANYYSGHEGNLGAYLEYGDASLQTPAPLYQDSRPYEQPAYQYHEYAYQEMNRPPNDNSRHWAPSPPTCNGNPPRDYHPGPARPQYSYYEERGRYPNAWNGDTGDYMGYRQNINSERFRNGDDGGHDRYQGRRHSDGGAENRFGGGDHWERNEQENFSRNEREPANSMNQPHNGGRSDEMPADGTAGDDIRPRNQGAYGYEGEGVNGKRADDTANGREDEGYDGYEEGYESLPLSFGKKRGQSWDDMGKGKGKKGKRGDSDNNKSITDKYFSQRYKLFSRYDQGIQMDTVSWYSVTPEIIGAHIARRFRKNLPANPVIVDAFCGAAGNTIQFCSGKCGLTIAIELIESRLQIAINNCKVYEVASKCEFILGNAYHVLPNMKASVVDAIFLSPPWGGPEYLNADSYNLSVFIDIVNIAKKITKNVAILVPRNIDTEQAVELFGRCEVEANYIGDSKKKYPKTVTIYFGDLVDTVTTQECDATWVELWQDTAKSNEDEKEDPESEAQRDEDKEERAHETTLESKKGDGGEKAIVGELKEEASGGNGLVSKDWGEEWTGTDDKAQSGIGSGLVSKDGGEGASGDDVKEVTSAESVLESQDVIVLKSSSEDKGDTANGIAPESTADRTEEDNSDNRENSSKPKDCDEKEDVDEIEGQSK